MAKWTAEKRKELPSADFGEPDSRLFPVADQEDLDSAAKLIGKAKNPDACKKRLLAIAARKGLTPPAAWTADATHAAFDAEFATGPAGTAEGKLVERKADVIFRAGEYPFPEDKGGPFSMTPEEIMAFTADFKAPVELEDTHAPSVFNGKLGHLVAVEPSADFGAFGGKVRIPSWFDQLFKGEPIKLSARWDRGTKRMTKLAVVPNPRITDAAMFAAFAAAETGADDTDPASQDKKTFTPHGAKLMQFIHDHAALHGACCKEENSPMHSNFAVAPGGDKLDLTKDAIFHTAQENETVQKIHDLALGSGAKCSIYTAPKGKNTDWRPGQLYHTVNEMPSYRDYRPGNYAMLSADQGHTTTTVNTPAKSAETQQLEAQFAAEKQRLEDQLAEERQKRRVDQRAAALAEGVAFAKGLRADKKILPYQEAGVAASFAQAALDDAERPTTVTFADAGGTTHTGNRVDQLRAHYAATPTHILTEEKVRETDQVLFNRTETPAEADLAEARRKAEAYAEGRNKLNGTGQSTGATGNLRHSTNGQPVK